MANIDKDSGVIYVMRVNKKPNLMGQSEPNLMGQSVYNLMEFCV